MTNIQSLIGGRAENQDFYGSAQTQYGELIVVCDGMGGHNGGRHAAEVAVQTILDDVSKNEDKNPVSALKSAIEKANRVICEESQTNRSLKGMGTTIVALLLTPENAISCHVGDSRIYQVRNGEILFRTFDHSHVFEMVKAGLITEEQARLSEKSNIITRALGIRPTVEIDITDNLSYQKDDRFLLCTDGICGAIPESELVNLITSKGNVETVVSNLVTNVDAIGVAKGNKHDNLTAALIEIDSENKTGKNEIKNGETIFDKTTGVSKKKQTGAIIQSNFKFNFVNKTKKSFSQIVAKIVIYSLILISLPFILWNISWGFIAGYLMLVLLVIGWLKYFRTKSLKYLLFTIIAGIFIYVVMLPLTLYQYKSTSSLYINKVEQGKHLNVVEKLNVYGLNIIISTVAYPFYPEVAKESFLMIFPAKNNERTFYSDFFMKSDKIKKAFLNNKHYVAWSGADYMRMDIEGRCALALNPCRLNKTNTGNSIVYKVKVEVAYPYKSHTQILPGIYIDEGLFHYLQNERWLHPFTAIWIYEEKLISEEK
jgi:serine/threonine protein phosphatase PrpC